MKTLFACPLLLVVLKILSFFIQSSSSNMTYILLEGRSSATAYNEVLRTLTYSYSRMSSLLENQPNIEDR